MPAPCGRVTEGCRLMNGVTDGIRTRDIQGHNLTLCQLSYGHHSQQTERM